MLALHKEWHNNTQMLHYQHEDDSSHAVYYILKPNWICYIELYISFDPIWHILSIMYHLQKSQIFFLSHVIKYTICLFAPFQLVFPKSVPGMCPTSQRWEFSKILRTLPLMDIIGSYAMVSLRIC